MINQRMTKKFRKALPFPHLVIDNFFDQKDLKKIKREILKEKFEYKDSDLFSLHQTKDFESTENKILQKFRNFLMSKEFISKIESMTGIKLSLNKISIAGNLYKNSNYLLCHDDRLEGRKIAFIIYLNETRGGELGLFSSKNEKPYRIIKRIKPKFNRLAFFEVSSKSFHEVLEVLGKERYTIAGWWYDQ